MSSHLKRSPLLWLHNKSRLCPRTSKNLTEKKWNGFVFHWCCYSKQNITWMLWDTKFLFESWKYFSLNTRRGISYLRGATYYPLSLTSGCLAALWGWLVPFAFPQTLAWLPYKKKSNWFKIRFSLDSVHKKRQCVEIQCCAHATPPNWNMSAVTRAKIICLLRHW